jgi:Xaa-Pro aminopeptidase
MTTTAAALAERLAKARKEQAERGMDALLLGPSADLAYLTGYHPPHLERLTLLVVPAAGDPRLVVPALEAPLARGQLGELEVEVAAWQETDDPVALVVDTLASAGAVGGRLGVGDQLWSMFLLRLQDALPAAGFTPASAVTSQLRMRKDPEELAALAKVAAAIDRVVDGLAELRWAGRSEQDLARDVEEAIRDTHDKFCFAIVASGPNAASPHHGATGRVIRPGDPVVVDIGGRLNGYCSDTTRTLVVGEPPPGFEELYGLLRAAQEAGCAAVRPQITAAQLDAACRDAIRAGGHGDAFLHRTGHGIGLEEHEAPYIVAGNHEPLEPNMAFSVEPGIYLDGRYGARIEDIVVCTEDGGRRLNTTSRDLRIVS